MISAKSILSVFIDFFIDKINLSYILLISRITSKRTMSNDTNIKEIT